MAHSVVGWAPASLSNLGPGFDALGVALEGVGDVVEARTVEGTSIVVRVEGADGLPIDPERNTAARAAARIAPGVGLELVVRKGIRPGSGLGSSAASAVAAAWAVARLLGRAGQIGTLLDAALEGEAAVSGARHGDNVIPSLLGGAVLVTPGHPERFRRLVLPARLHFGIVRPDIDILTRDARAMLPSRVPLRDAARNAAALAFLVDALRSGDLETVGSEVERDLLVEPVRARLVPPFSAIRAAAREAGAFGCALSGSGPTMFALAGDAAAAARAADAMADACRRDGHGCVSFVTRDDPGGARDWSPDLRRWTV